MIDIEDWNFGDKAYVVVEINNMMSRNRICMTDANGVVWHRYDNPPRSYRVEVREYCGKMTPLREGITAGDPDDDFAPEHYFRLQDGTVHGYMSGSETWDNGYETWFDSKNEADDAVILNMAEESFK